jgi:hypothetical protein
MTLRKRCVEIFLVTVAFGGVFWWVIENKTNWLLPKPLICRRYYDGEACVNEVIKPFDPLNGDLQLAMSWTNKGLDYHGIITFWMAEDLCPPGRDKGCYSNEPGDMNIKAVRVFGPRGLLIRSNPEEVSSFYRNYMPSDEMAKRVWEDARANANLLTTRQVSWSRQAKEVIAEFFGLIVSLIGALTAIRSFSREVVEVVEEVSDGQDKGVE